jgi:hypothetical protein
MHIKTAKAESLGVVVLPHLNPGQTFLEAKVIEW